MPVAKKGSSKKQTHDARWYRKQRHDNQERNQFLFDSPGWYYCDPDTFYRLVFGSGSLQADGVARDGRGNIIVLEDTGVDVPLLEKDGSPSFDKNGNPKFKRKTRRYTVSDDLHQLEELRHLSVKNNTFMMLAPISYWGKSRKARNAHELYAIFIDLDYVGVRELKNLLYQMESGRIPYANAIVSSGTGLHIVFLLDEPFPMQTRYIDGLVALKRELTRLIWTPYTSHSKVEERQEQSIHQSFRMVGSATKLNGDIGNPKFKQAYVVEAFTHDATPRASIDYLLSFLPMLSTDGLCGKEAIGELSKRERKARKQSVPLEVAAEKWPEWYKTISDGNANGAKKTGRYYYHRGLYEKAVRLAREQGSVGHRYFCIRMVAIAALKCGISYEELESDALSLGKIYETLTDDPTKKFTRNDVYAALRSYEGNSDDARALKASAAQVIAQAHIKWEKTGVKATPVDKRLKLDQSLEIARAVRDKRQEIAGTHWWDNGNREGAPKKAMQVWDAAYKNEGAPVAEIARIAGVSRPTVYKWLGVENWKRLYRDELSCLEYQEMADRQDAEIRTLEAKGIGPVEELIPMDPAEAEDLEKDIVLQAAMNPWKSLDEIGAYFLVTGKDVESFIDKHRDYYNNLVANGVNEFDLFRELNEMRGQES